VSDIKKYSSKTFDQIKHFTDEGNEFWYARELVSVLDYKSWDKFKNVIEKAKESCKNSGLKVEDHFSHVGNMVDVGSGAQREIDNIMLSRYACYLIVQNGDPRKEVIALGQTYFAVKTRERELEENYEQLTDDQKRLAIRNEMINHNKSLAEAAQIAGIDDPRDYAIFQNKGYQGLYGGFGVKEIHQRKGLKKSHKILDHRSFWHRLLIWIRLLSVCIKSKASRKTPGSTDGRTRSGLKDKIIRSTLFLPPV